MATEVYLDNIQFAVEYFQREIDNFLSDWWSEILIKTFYEFFVYVDFVTFYCVTTRGIFDEIF